jgi:hypothetical protein
MAVRVNQISYLKNIEALQQKKYNFANHNNYIELQSNFTNPMVH